MGGLIVPQLTRGKMMPQPDIQTTEERPDLVIDQLNEFHALEAQKKFCAKRQEEIKKHVLLAVGLKNGTITVTQSGFKISTVGKETISVNASIWDSVKEQVPPEFWPIKQKSSIEPDVQKIAAMKFANPELWNKIASAFETKNAKPQVKIARLKVAANDG